MSKDTVPVTVRILEKEYRISCPRDEKDALVESAQYLHQKMLQTRDVGRIVGTDKIAVMAALNIAHELLQSKTEQQEFSPALSNRLRSLQDKIETALYQDRQMEL